MKNVQYLWKQLDITHVLERNVTHCIKKILIIVFKNINHVLLFLNVYKNILDVYKN